MKAKSMTSNFIFNLLYNLLNIVFPMITIPYLSRILMPEGIGKVSYAQSIVTYFLIFAQLGIPRYGVREIAKVRDDKEKLSNTCFEILLINTISTTIVLVIYYLLILKFHFFANRTLLFAVAGLTIFFNYLNCDWLYQGLEEYKYITKRSLLVKLISLLLILTFVKTKDDAILYALIYTIGIGGNNIFNIINAKKYISKPICPIHLKKHISPIFILLSTNLAVEFYTQLDTVMTGAMCGEIYVGYYTNTSKFIRLVVTIITTIGAVLLPRLSYEYENKKYDSFRNYIEKAFKIIVFFSIPATSGMLLFSSPIVINILGDQFIPSIMTLRILSLLIPILSIGNLFGTQVLMITNNEHQLLKSVFVGAVINIILNSFLIPRLYQNGAAIASLISELTVMCIQVFYASKFIRIKLNWRFVVSTIVPNIAIIIYGIVITQSIQLSIYTLFISVFVSIIIYAFMSLVLKNEVAIFLVGKCKNIQTKIYRR